MKRILKKKSRSFSVISILILLCIAFFPIFTVHIHYLQEQAILQENPLSEKSKIIILERVSRRMQAPRQTPTILLVTNKDVLKKAPYYTMVNNNDLVVFYKKEDFGFVYNPTNDVITAAINTKDFSLKSYEKIIR